MKSIKKDVIVIGGGAGGLIITSVASQLGLKTLLVDKGPKLGGDCLHYGCVPSKTLIHFSNLTWSHFKHLPHHPKLSEEHFLHAMQQVHRAIQTIQVHDEAQRFESYGAQVEFGEAHFLSEKTIQVREKVFQAKKIFIATGSSPWIPPIAGLENTPYLTNETVFSLKSRPNSLLIIGGGPIGVELAQALNRLGVRIVLVEPQARLLMPFDPEISSLIKTVMQEEGIEVYTSTTINNIKSTQSNIQATLEDSHGVSKTLIFENILIATGRQPNTKSLKCESANIKATEKGIQVNSKLQTANKKVYAIGDVVDSPYRFTHMAEYHAGIAIANALFLARKKTNYRAVPSVVFSSPECAMVGMSETQALENKLAFEILRFDFDNVDRAIAQDQTLGFVKVLVHKKRIIGAQMVGPMSSELIAELTLAVQQKLKLADISSTIHAYPTLSQIHRRAVNTYYAPKLFNWKTRILVKLFNLF